MNEKTLETKILELLPGSTIPSTQKELVVMLLPVMKLENMKGICDALENEKKKMDDLHKRKERTELKYKIMIEKLTEIQLNKHKND